MKTEQEIKSAVLDECWKLTLNWFVGVQVDLKDLPCSSVSKRWPPYEFDLHFSGLSIAIDSDTKPSEYAIAYRILGLQARDAVEAERQSCAMHSNALDECWRISRTIATKWKNRAYRLLSIARKERQEAERLRHALEEIKSDALAKLAINQGINSNETLHTINNALNP